MEALLLTFTVLFLCGQTSNAAVPATLRTIRKRGSSPKSGRSTRIWALAPKILANIPGNFALMPYKIAEGGIVNHANTNQVVGRHDLMWP